MKITSDQIRAARALLRLDQAEVARRAGVSAVTVRRLEAGTGRIADSTVVGALEEAGVEFIERGVRQRQRDPDEIRARVQAIRDIARRYPTPREEPPFTEDDLYDENGLPA